MDYRLRYRGYQPLVSAATTLYGYARYAYDTYRGVQTAYDRLNENKFPTRQGKIRNYARLLRWQPYSTRRGRRTTTKMRRNARHNLPPRKIYMVRFPRNALRKTKVRT